MSGSYEASPIHLRRLVLNWVQVENFHTIAVTLFTIRLTKSAYILNTAFQFLPFLAGM
jgi:hypothetical protein